MTRLVVSVTRPARRGEDTFIEAGRSGLDVTYGTFLTAADCARIDDEAYAAARTWYQSSSGEDLSCVGGVSLGLALEHPIVLRLVAHLRARFVLRRLQPDTLILHGASPGWDTAAAELGVAFELPRPDRPERQTHSAAGPLGEGLLTRLLNRRGGSPRLLLIHPTDWAHTDYLSLALRIPTIILDPGRRLPMALALRGRKAGLHQLAALPTAADMQPFRNIAATHRFGAIIESVIEEHGARLLRAAMDVHELPVEHAVAISTEDASPVTRASVLALKARGLRTIVLEHGISGSYRHQVQSVAHTLGVWGHPQADYHRPRQAISRLAVIGATRMERLYHDAARKPAYDAVYFAQPAPTLSAASWPEDHVRAWSMVGEIARLHPEWRIVVKPHPAAGSYGWTQPDLPSPPVVTEGSAELIRRAAIVIVVTSTAGAEAMASGVPVVQISTRGPMAEPSLLLGGSQQVATPRELEEIVHALLTDASVRARAIDRARAHARALVAGVETPGSALQQLSHLIAIDD